jgi:uncharacterized membrane protein
MEENKNQEYQEEKGKGVDPMAIISYIGPLCLIPYFTKGSDDFVKFHAKQGLILFIFEALTWLIFRILPFWWWYLMNIVSLVWIAFTIIGIINVVNKQKKELPIIGGLAGKIKS